MLIIFAILIGLGINYWTWWIHFSAIICLFAGLFLIMPGLLNFAFADFQLLAKEKKLTIVNVLLNVFILPTLFVVSWFLFFPRNPEIWYSLAMLAILPGGWLLMSWIDQSRANKKYGFSLFVLNMTIFVVLFLGLNYLITTMFTEKVLYDTATATCEVAVATNWLASCGAWSHSKPILAYVFLIIIPFLVSRLIRFFPRAKDFLQKHIPLLSKWATFLIIAYIFSLQNIHGIFGQDLASILQIFIAVLVGYILVFGVSFFVTTRLTKTPIPDQKALFRNGTIRFITLWLVFGVLYVPYLGPTYITVFASAYVIQTLLSMWSLWLWKKKDSWLSSS